MIEIELSREEKKILRDVLKADISDLGMEISSTDRLDYRNILKEKRQALTKVVDILPQ